MTSHEQTIYALTHAKNPVLFRSVVSYTNDRLFPIFACFLLFFVSAPTRIFDYSYADPATGRSDLLSRSSGAKIGPGTPPMPEAPFHSLDFSCPTFQFAVEQLIDARISAESLKQEVWSFAVELPDLVLGCTRTALRTLVAAGYLQHAEETTCRSDPLRTFRPECPMKFGARSCFVLTDAGFAFLSPYAHRLPVRCDPPRAKLAATESTPYWNPDAREFSVGPQLLKRFTRPAPMLDIILSSFQELDWPLRLDDPIPPTPGIVSAERLRDTVRRLNRCQNPHAVRFSSDGLGLGLRWSLTTRPRVHGCPTDEP